jgi:hypothetical protein
MQLANMNHTLPRHLNAGVKTNAYWSLNPMGHLIVFVHGFGGGAEGTWMQFPRCAIGAPEFVGRDLVFYGYDGLQTEAFLSGVELYRFIEKIADVQLVQDTLPPYPKRDPNFAFNRITVVAHSLGAIVSRLAFLEAYRDGAPWISNSELVLFAPAHLGAKIGPLVSEALSIFKIFAVIEAVATGWYQVLRDLKPGSPILQRLENDTRAALSSGRANFVKAKKVIVTRTDRVVDNMRFCEDPAPVEIAGVSHMSICKPSDNAHQAYLHLVSVL